MKLFGMLGSLIVYFCIGTVLAGCVLLGVMWSKGALSGDRFTALMAALYGLPFPARVATTNVSNSGSAAKEAPSFEQIQEKRMLASLDIDLRESALDKSLADLRNIETQIRDERKRLDQWKLSFDKRLADLESANTNQAMQELQRTLEAMQPKQAKEQILKILEAPPTKTNRPLDDVVTILKAMAADKRKKILAEFKTADEAEKLSNILKEIRLGTPDSELIRDSRSQLQQQLNPSEKR